MYYYQKDNPTPTPPPQSDFPAGFQLVAWVQMNDFIVLDTGPQFYGFVAQSVSDQSKFVLALRGTEDPTEWFDNVTSIVKVPFPAPGCGSVSLRVQPDLRHHGDHRRNGASSRRGGARGGFAQRAGTRVLQTDSWRP